jgi:hypothetical protein
MKTAKYIDLNTEVMVSYDGQEISQAKLIHSDATGRCTILGRVRTGINFGINFIKNDFFPTKKCKKESYCFHTICGFCATVVSVCADLRRR